MALRDAASTSGVVTLTESELVAHCARDGRSQSRRSRLPMPCASTSAASCAHESEFDGTGPSRRGRKRPSRRSPLACTCASRRRPHLPPLPSPADVAAVGSVAAHGVKPKRWTNSRFVPRRSASLRRRRSSDRAPAALRSIAPEAIKDVVPRWAATRNCFRQQQARVGATCKSHGDGPSEPSRELEPLPLEPSSRQEPWAGCPTLRIPP